MANAIIKRETMFIISISVFLGFFVVWDQFMVISAGRLPEVAFSMPPSNNHTAGQTLFYNLLLADFSQLDAVHRDPG
jgi:hypothetical protein